MNSELVKKLDAELIRYKRQFLGDIAYGIDMARQIVKEHEAQQMKEPFYQLDEKEEKLLHTLKSEFTHEKLTRIDLGIDKKVKGLIYVHSCSFQVVKLFAEWAIEQEKLEEEMR